MPILLVVNNPKKWPLKIPGVSVTQAKQYITDPSFAKQGNTRVYNLCSSYRYQSTGYYVSLLAEARGHKPIPNTQTIRDLQVPSITRIASEDLDDLIQQSLAPIQAPYFTLSIYFGRNVAKRYDRLSLQLFNLFQAPLLRAHFKRRGRWHLKNISPIAVSDVPESHRPFLVEVASDYFKRPRTLRPRKLPRYYMAILHNPSEDPAPSNARALKNFIKAAAERAIEADLITRDDLGRLPEYDALFIRETTAVNNHTFLFARRAKADGMVVIDDPLSILKCANKVYLAELLTRHKIPTPRTVIVHKDNIASLADELGLPCILKQPDSSFSLGVIKTSTREELMAAAGKMLSESELVVAQEFMPTPFDWRVGVLDNQPLFACRYYMARNHWQVVKWHKSGRKWEGGADTLPVEETPPLVLETALKAARLIGDGLYGVDLKLVGDKCYVIEVNDNPNIDAGCEDSVLKKKIYGRVMDVFLSRIEQRTGTSEGT